MDWRPIGRTTGYTQWAKIQSNFADSAGDKVLKPKSASAVDRYMDQSKFLAKMCTSMSCAQNGPPKSTRTTTINSWIWRAPSNDVTPKNAIFAQSEAEVWAATLSHAKNHTIISVLRQTTAWKRRIGASTAPTISISHHRKPVTKKSNTRRAAKVRTTKLPTTNWAAMDSKKQYQARRKTR